jgi:hypothetical protein
MLCLLLVGMEKKKKRKVTGGFFPRAGHATVCARQDFMAVRCK